MRSHFSGILRVRKFWHVVIYKRKDSSKKTSKKTIIMFSLKKNVCISTISDGLFVNVYGKQMYQSVYSVVVK